MRIEWRWSGTEGRQDHQEEGEREGVGHGRHANRGMRAIEQSSFSMCRKHPGRAETVCVVVRRRKGWRENERRRE